MGFGLDAMIWITIYGEKLWAVVNSESFASSIVDHAIFFFNWTLNMDAIRVSFDVSGNINIKIANCLHEKKRYRVLLPDSIRIL